MHQTNEGNVKDPETSQLLRRLPIKSLSPRSESSSADVDSDYDDRNDFSGYTSNKHYSVFSAIIYMVNYSVGGGILGIPYQYSRAGYILGTLILCWTGWLTYISYKYVCNQLLRAEAVTTIALRYGLRKSRFINNPELIINNLRDNVTLANFEHELKQFKRNEYELNHICGIFCGKRWRIGYEISFITLTIVGLWSFMVLFGASLARIAGISSISSSCDIETESNNYNCRLLYSFYVCMFWIWCTIIVLLDFTEQKFVQYGSFFARFSIVLLIIITSIGLMYGNLYYSKDSGKYYKRDNDNVPYYGDGTAAWKWNGFMDCYATAIFGLTSQYCIPDILHPLRASDKQKKMKFIMKSGIVILVSIFVITGLVVSLYFGDDTEGVCTLAWKYFIGFVWNDGKRPKWSYFVGYFIVLLPPVDLLCSFPLNAITTAQTIRQSICDLDRLHNDLHYARKWNVIISVSTVALPAICSLCVVRFSFVIVIAGVFALISLYIIPAYSEYKSRQMCKIITNDVDGIETPIMGLEKSTFWIYATIISSIIAAIGVIVEFFE